MAGASRFTVAVRSSVIFSGSPIGAISKCMGEKAAASSTAIQRSAVSTGVKVAFVESTSRCEISAGNGTPAFGGCEESRNARITRPIASAASTSPNHNWSSSSWRVRRSSRSSSARARVPLSRATMGSSLAATTERRSRRSISPASFFAASARSYHSATRSWGRNFSASCKTEASGIVALPSLVAFSFSAFRRVRTAAIP